jgi:hypothetical protein
MEIRRQPQLKQKQINIPESLSYDRFSYVSVTEKIRLSFMRIEAGTGQMI